MFVYARVHNELGFPPSVRHSIDGHAHSIAAVAYSVIGYSQRLAISIGTLLSHSLVIGMHLLRLRNIY